MTNSPLNPQKGEVWYVCFDPTIGSEMQKIRPAVVVGENGIGRTGLRIVVPVTEWKKQYESYPWITQLPSNEHTGLKKVSGAEASQVKSLSIRRFTSNIGVVSAIQLEEITDAIALCIGF